MSDMINRVDSHYLLEVTDFLNPREITILKSLAAPTDLKVFPQQIIIQVSMVV